MIRFKLDTTTIQKKLEKLTKEIDNKPVYWKAIGIYLFQQLIETFDKSGKRDDHEEWDELHPGTIRWKKSKGYSKPLLNAGEVRNSFQIITAYRGNVTFGSRHPVAKKLHFGDEFVLKKRKQQIAIGLSSGIWIKLGTTIVLPARELLFITDNDVDNIVRKYNLFKDFVNK